MKFHALNNLYLTIFVSLSIFITGCGGKYFVKTFPAGAKVYLKDIQTQERKLIGTSPVEIQEESRLGSVFFLEFEKPNYATKEVMVKVNDGESLTVSARMDPLTGAEQAAELAKNTPKPEDDKKPQGQPPQDDKKKKLDEMEDLKLRVALLENTVSFYKDAMFSARFKGGPEKFDRDSSETVIGLLFQSQQAVAKRNFKQAGELIDKAIRMDEYSSNAWMLKGSVAYLQNDMDAAKVAWEKTLKIDPFNKIAYRYLNEVYKKVGIQELPARGPDVRAPTSVKEIDKRMNINNKITR
jgi:tetratricopeptide (TPR) repeat protein